MVRSGGDLRTMAVSVFCEDFLEDLRNTLLQTGQELSLHADSI